MERRGSRLSRRAFVVGAAELGLAAERTQIEQAELVARLERRAVGLLETWVTQQARCLALCDVIHAIAVVQGRSAEDPSPSATED